METSAAELKSRGRWYFPWRAVTAAVDYAIYGAFYFAYVRYFGSSMTRR